MENLSDTERPVCNLEASLKRLGGNRQLLRELIDIYLDDYQKLLEQMKEAVDAGDYSATSRFAHSLKGLASNFDSEPVSEIAKSVSLATSSGTASEPKTDLQALGCAAKLLAEELIEARRHWEDEARD